MEIDQSYDCKHRNTQFIQKHAEAPVQRKLPLQTLSPPDKLAAEPSRPDSATG